MSGFLCMTDQPRTLSGMGAIDWSKIQQNVAATLASKLPEIGIGALSTIIGSKLEDKYGVKVDKPAAAPAPAPAPAPVIMQAPRPQLAQYLPYIVGGIAILGGVAFLASQRRRRR